MLLYVRQALEVEVKVACDAKALVASHWSGTSGASGGYKLHVLRVRTPWLFL